MSNKTTAEKADLWEATFPLLRAMHTEFRELSRKKPDDALNKRKIAAVNRLLERCRQVLETELTREFLEGIDEDDVPQNSDVVLILSQYVASMEQYQGMYRDHLYGWRTEDQDEDEAEYEYEEGDEDPDA